MASVSTVAMAASAVSTVTMKLVSCSLSMMSSIMAPAAQKSKLIIRRMTNTPSDIHTPLQNSMVRPIDVVHNSSI